MLQLDKQKIKAKLLSIFKSSKRESVLQFFKRTTSLLSSINKKAANILSEVL